MTAVNPTMTIDKKGKSSASRSRRKSTEKTGPETSTNLESNIILSGATPGSTSIEAKYTKVTATS